MTQISGWPTVLVDISLLSLNSSATMVPSAPNDTTLTPVYTNVGSRCRMVSTTRGKSYELDQPRSNMNTLTFDNRDGMFDPYNTTGQLYPQLTTHKQVRFHAYNPVQNRNLLEPQVATAGQNYQSTYQFAQQNTALSLDTTGIALSGNTCLRSLYPAGTVSGGFAWATGSGMLVAGTQYTFSVYAMQTGTALNFGLAAQCFSSAGVSIGTFIGSNVSVGGSWTRLTLTFTAPAGTIATQFLIGNTATVGASPFNLYTDQLQLETGASASTWIMPSALHEFIGGYIESIKQYVDPGTYMGLADVSVVDILGPLSQTILMSTEAQEILWRNPYAYFPLGDSVKSAAAGAVVPPLQVAAAPNAATLNVRGGGSTVSFGNSSLLPACPSDNCLNFATGAVTGTSWTSLLMGTRNSGTYVNSATTGVAGVSFWFSGASNGTVDGLIFAQSQIVENIDFAVSIKTTGQILFQVGNTNTTANTSDTIITSGTGFATGTHFVVAQVYSANARMQLYVDGVLIGDIARTGTVPFVGAQVSQCVLGNGVGGEFPYVGSVQHVAFWEAQLTSTDVSVLYQAGATGFANELTSARAARILRYAGVNTILVPPVFGSFQLESSLNDCSGQSALDALNLINQDEQGNFFVSGQGWVEMEARHDRARQLTPVWILGDQPGQIGYTPTVTLELDDVKVVNYLQATVPSGTTQTVTNAASVKRHFVRSYPNQLTLKIDSANDVSAVLSGLLWRFADSSQRGATIEFDPTGENAGLIWAFLSGLDIGQRVQFNRKPFGAGTILLDQFIESISMSVQMDQQTNKWIATIETSPGYPNGPTAGQTSQPFLATAARTTLKTATAANATSFTLNPLSDSATNTSQSDGWTASAITQVIIWDGANTEVLPVLSFSTTTVGYTSYTLTTTASLHAHGVGVTISEFMLQPAGLNWTYNTFDTAAVTDGSNVIIY
jgi:hypothetical protein